MKKKDWLFIIKSFLVWRFLIFIIAFFAIRYVPLQEMFLGGGLGNYLKAPLFWTWSNFDGEHYLSIAQNGYGWGEQAFFPLYPLLIRLIGNLFGGSLFAFNLAGILISNISFFIALIGFYKLVRLDYSESVSKLAVILLLLFPTSFYFGAVYTESLFLALTVWSFYSFKKGNYLFASILGMFASAARVIGVFLLPIYLIELVRKNKLLEKGNFKIKLEWLSLLLIPLGLFSYMYYLYTTSGDFLLFVHALPGFGEQRSSTPIILPQVFYRYIFKILPSLNYNYFPVVFCTLLEFVIAILFLSFSVFSFFRLRLSYALFLGLGYLVPTLSGSFSSFPRYVLILFPAFILAADSLSRRKNYLRAILLTLSFILLGIATSLFIRGYWVS